jgi:hypothetical protein
MIYYIVNKTQSAYIYTIERNKTKKEINNARKRVRKLYVVFF